ncbi:hypothetical protein ABK046_44975, partial [Streptomyces caeruleatus]
SLFATVSSDFTIVVDPFDNSPVWIAICLDICARALETSEISPSIVSPDFWDASWSGLLDALAKSSN